MRKLSNISVANVFSLTRLTRLFLRGSNRIFKNVSYATSISVLKYIVENSNC